MYLSIKYLQSNCFTDIFYSILFSLLGVYGILLVVISMNINNKLIGKRIKHRREIAGFSQEQLAEQLNLSKNHISSIECGKSMLTTKSLIALCNVLGGTPDYYLIGEITPETDSMTTLIQHLSPDEQKKLCRLLDAYLNDAD